MPEAILYWLKVLRIKRGSSKSREFIDLEIIMLSEVSQREKDKYDIAYMWTLRKKRMIQMTLYTQQK